MRSGVRDAEWAVDRGVCALLHKLIECEGPRQTQPYAERGDACPQLKLSDLLVPGSFDRRGTWPDRRRNRRHGLTIPSAPRLC
jgi:hypothetical protein